MDRQEEQIAHERKGITAAVVRKTAPNGSIPSHYEFATDRGNPRRLALMDVIALFEDISLRSGAGREPGTLTDVGRSLGVVLVEIDEIARATFRSITVDTMLKLVERQKRAG